MDLHEVLFASKMVRNSENSEADFSDYVKKSDYATKEKVGVMRPGGGLDVQNTGVVEVASATNAEILAGTNNYKPIVPANLASAMSAYGIKSKTQIDEMLSTLAGETVTGKVYNVNGTQTTAKKGAEVFNDYENNKATGIFSHAEGGNTTASGSCSHAEGNYTKALAISSHAEGSNTTASGQYSHAEGSNTTASGQYSHAEGNYTKALAISSHAEGSNTTASGQYSHAEGSNTTASGQYSHAEGSQTTASGAGSHAEGWYTVASSDNSHVMGKFNVEDTEEKFVFIIGNGTSQSARSNAFAIDWQGNIYVNNSNSPVNVLDLMNRLSALEAKVTALEAKEEN